MHLGPFSTQALTAALAILVAWRLPRLALRNAAEEARRAVSGLVLDAILLGLVAARLGYVLCFWADYRAEPRAILAIGDGGFLLWAGLAAALAWVFWRSRSARSLRRPALFALGGGLAVWALGLVLLAALQRGVALPELQLGTLDGRALSTRDFAGRPLVLNLWATWCPPCRREMPVLTVAGAAHPEVAFLLVNQGEDAASVRAWLAAQGLDASDVLLDPGSTAMQASGSRVLPTTLFFDAGGRMVDSHVGELTAARLRDILQRRLEGPTNAVSPEE